MRGRESNADRLPRSPLGHTSVAGGAMTDPIDVARSFVLGGTSPKQIDELLTAWTDERTTQQLAATQILFDSSYGFTYERELRARAACALLAFGLPGFEAIVDSIGRERSSLSTVSLGLKVLGAAAYGDVDLLRNHAVPTLLSRIAAQCAAIPSETRRAFNLEAALRVPDERTLMLALSALSAEAAFDERWGATIARIVSARTLAVSHHTIANYRQKLRDQSDDEPALHAFLEEHPTLIDPLAQSVWSKPSLDGQLFPDFVVRRRDDTYLVVEIETPAKAIVRTATPLQISAETTHALQQAVGYAEFLNRRAVVLQERFPRLAQVDALVVIGRQDALSSRQLEVLRRDNASRHGVRTVGFDWIADRAESVLRSLTETLQVELLK